MSAFEPSLLALETERLRLRPLNAGDEALYHDLYTDPETMRFIAPPLSEEKAARTFHKVVALQQEPTLASRFMVIEEKKAGQRALGICGTSKYEVDTLRVEVGIVLKSEGRSRGLAQEALGALMNRIFAVSPVQEVYVRFSAHCPAMRRLNSRIGFMPCKDEAQEEGALSKCVWSAHRSSWYVNPPTENQLSGEYECRM